MQGIRNPGLDRDFEAIMEILIAEEDPIARQILVSTLRSWGYRVAIAQDRHEIRARLCEHDAPPIAILDWPRSDLETPELFCRLQQLPPDRQPYVIVTAPKGHDQDIVAALWAGADDSLTKPFHFAELRSRVQVGERIAKLQARLHDFELQRAVKATA